MKEILFHAKRIDNNQWVEGFLSFIYTAGRNSNGFIHTDKAKIYSPEDVRSHDVYTATVGQFTGKIGKNNKKIFQGDITELTLESGEVRRFVVDIRTVTRTIVSHPDFDDETAKVEITGVVFLWKGYELFPCIDSSGASNVSRMVVIGNIYDNPELIDEGGVLQ